jgi:hypothetical protein
MKVRYKNDDFPSTNMNKTKIRKKIEEKTLCSAEQNLQCIIPLFQRNIFYKTLQIIDVAGLSFFRAAGVKGRKTNHVSAIHAEEEE